MKRAIPPVSVSPKCPRLSTLSTSSTATWDTARLGHAAATCELSQIRANLERRRSLLEIKEACGEPVSHQERTYLQFGEVQLAAQEEAARHRELWKKKQEVIRIHREKHGPMTWQDFLSGADY